MKARRLIAIGLADAATLVIARPDLGALLSQLRAPHRWVARVGVDAAAGQLATAALWLLAAWVGLGLLAALARALPGHLGRAGDLLARLVLPAVCYRAVAGAVGLGVLAAPVVASARPAQLSSAAAPTRPVTTAPASSPTGSPLWPTDPGLPVPSWPTTGPSPTTTPPPTTRPKSARAVASPVTVRPGECLWLIAAARLGPTATDPQIAAAWPRWYAANRALIGPAPDQLATGLVLQPPPGPVRG